MRSLRRRLRPGPSGNGSPAAHTAPSTKVSFFQMGTVFLSVSISQRQASKACARWAEATTISTLVSPTSSRPSRCTIVTWRTPNCAARLARPVPASASRPSPHRPRSPGGASARPRVLLRTMPSKTTTAPSSPRLAAATSLSASIGERRQPRLLRARLPQMPAAPRSRRRPAAAGQLHRPRAALACGGIFGVDANRNAAQRLAPARASARLALSKSATVAPSGSSTVAGDEPSQSFSTPKGRTRTCITLKRIPPAC